MEIDSILILSDSYLFCILFLFSGRGRGWCLVGVIV